MAKSKTAKTGAGELTEQISILSSAPVAAAVTSITRSGQTATVTTPAAHGYITGDSITHAGAAQSEYNVEALITVTNSTVYTFTVSGTPATPATGTITTIYTGDGQGGMRAGSWTVATIWAEVLPLSASEQLAAGGIAAIIQYRAKVYYRPDLKPTMTVSWTKYQETTARILQIHGISDVPGELRRMLHLDLGEVAA